MGQAAGSPEGELAGWVLYPEAFISFLGISGEGFSRISIGSPGVSFQGCVSTDWSVAGQGALSHCSWFWHCPPGFAAFLGLELKHN